jgi:serine protease Do
VIAIAAGACSKAPAGGSQDRATRLKTERNDGELADLADRAMLSVVRVKGAGDTAQATGSGFVVRGKDGTQFVLSSHHVVWGASGLTLGLRTGTSVAATVVGVDPDMDLAVLRPASVLDVPALSFGDDRPLRPGDGILTLGWPDGSFDAVSYGVLSARGKVPAATLAGERAFDYLFTDAVLSPGMSGGPALDVAGNVIGVNTAVLGNGRGFGILLPAHLAAELANRLESR